MTDSANDVISYLSQGRPGGVGALAEEVLEEAEAAYDGCDELRDSDEPRNWILCEDGEAEEAYRAGSGRFLPAREEAIMAQGARRYAYERYKESVLRGYEASTCGEVV